MSYNAITMMQPLLVASLSESTCTFRTVSYSEGCDVTFQKDVPFPKVRLKVNHCHICHKQLNEVHVYLSKSLSESHSTYCVAEKWDSPCILGFVNVSASYWRFVWPAYPNIQGTLLRPVWMSDRWCGAVYCTVFSKVREHIDSFRSWLSGGSHSWLSPRREALASHVNQSISSFYLNTTKRIQPNLAAAFA